MPQLVSGTASANGSTESILAKDINIGLGRAVAEGEQVLLEWEIDGRWWPVDFLGGTRMWNWSAGSPAGLGRSYQSAFPVRWRYTFTGLLSDLDYLLVSAE